MNSEFTQ